jgi:2-oxoglutarate ferredoxin oxidoreductase subunit gamma
MKYEIRLSGKGGQGLVLVGIILGEAAALYENLYAVQKQSYGPEARSGASRSDVIISDQEIEYPVVEEADLLLAMSQEAYEKYSSQMKKDAILIIDQSLVSLKSTDPIQKIYRFDFTKVARRDFNLEIVANMIALGTVIHLMKFIPKESTLDALSQRVPPKFLAVNEKAFELGISIAREVTL